MKEYNAEDIFEIKGRGTAYIIRSVPFEPDIVNTIVKINGKEVLVKKVEKVRCVCSEHDGIGILE